MRVMEVSGELDSRYDLAKYGEQIDAIVTTNREGRIIRANKEAEELLGYGPHELLGQMIEVLVPERLRTEHVLHRESEPARHHVRLFGAVPELYVMRKDRSEFPADIMLIPME